MAADPKRKVTRRPLASASQDALEIPQDRMLAAIINELARSRVRHRALLDLLEAHAVVDMAKYVERYRSQEERDFKPFVELLLLSPEQFRERWSDWVSANEERYGYDGASRVSIRLATSSPSKARPKKERSVQGARVKQEALGKKASRR